MENVQEHRSEFSLGNRAQMAIGASLAALYIDIIFAELPKKMHGLLLKLEEKEQNLDSYPKPAKEK